MAETGLSRWAIISITIKLAQKAGVCHLEGFCRYRAYLRWSTCCWPPVRARMRSLGRPKSDRGSGCNGPDNPGLSNRLLSVAGVSFKTHIRGRSRLCLGFLLAAPEQMCTASEPTPSCNHFSSSPMTRNVSARLQQPFPLLSGSPESGSFSRDGRSKLSHPAAGCVCATWMQLDGATKQPAQVKPLPATTTTTLADFNCEPSQLWLAAAEWPNLRNCVFGICLSVFAISERYRRSLFIIGSKTIKH